ncbi:MAG: GAF domain-containing protein, partial [Candidatus Delongbacteria bacterium]|nr:GAF domain-containing protein [Candidatus Delongbacteria bacterium]
MNAKKEDQFKSNDQFRTLFEYSHDAMIISNEKKEILLANTSAEKIFGYKENELIGKSIIELMPKDRRSNYDNEISDILKNKVVTNRDNYDEFLGLRSNGEVFPIELTFTGWKSENDNYFNSQIRDISERKSYESDLRLSNRSLEVISRCNKALINAEDEISYFKDICNTIVAIGSYKIAWIGLVKDDIAKSIEPIAYQGYEQGFLESCGLTWKLHGQKTTGPSARAVNTKKVAICNNIQDDPKYDFWRKEARKRGYNSLISIPLIVDEKVEAVLVILSEKPEAYNKEEIQLLEQLSSDISFGIKALRLKKAQAVIEDYLKENEKRLLLSNRYLQVISQCNKSLAEANNVEEYLEDICKIIVNVGGHLKSLVQRVNYRGSVTIDTLAIYGNSLGEYEEKQVLTQGVESVGLTAICVEEKRPVVYQNIIGSGNYIYWDKDPKKIKFQSAVVIPMIKNDQVVGTLRVFSREPFSYSNKEVELLQDLANDIAYGIDLIKSKEKGILVESKLNESENKYKNLFEDSNDAIFLADA